jgi:hypothetical protein
MIVWCGGATRNLGIHQRTQQNAKNLPPPFRLFRSMRVSPPPLVGGGDTRGTRVSPPRSRMCSKPLLRRPGAFSWQFAPPEIFKKTERGETCAKHNLRVGAKGGRGGGGGGGGEEKPTLRQNCPAHKVIFCERVVGSHGYIAQWLERLTADQQVPGSNPGVPLF